VALPVRPAYDESALADGGEYGTAIAAVEKRSALTSVLEQFDRIGVTVGQCGAGWYQGRSQQ
jgi:hypothetical protein